MDVGSATAAPADLGLEFAAGTMPAKTRAMLDFVADLAAASSRRGRQRPSSR